jgi:hypothetical protein
MVINHSLTQITKIVLVSIVFALMTACATTRPIDFQPSMIYQEVDIGDTLRIYTKENTVITLDFVEVTPQAIVGARERVLFDDIVKIEKQDNPWQFVWQGIYNPFQLEEEILEE